MSASPSITRTIAFPPDNADTQPFPRSGQLAQNLNASRADLLRELSSNRGTVYCYTVDSVEDVGGWFEQRGSGPNMCGDRITLCTCKHLMRTYLDVDQWPNTWIAGLTGKNKVGDGRQYLFYLMRVDEAFESQRDLWEWLPEETRLAKSATLNRHGDVFQPWAHLRDQFNPDHYERPRWDHVHCSTNNWHGDIIYSTPSGQRAALLAGDPNYSYIWDEPTIAASFLVGRAQKKMTMQPFLSALR